MNTHQCHRTHRLTQRDRCWTITSVSQDTQADSERQMLDDYCLQCYERLRAHTQCTRGDRETDGVSDWAGSVNASIAAVAAAELLLLLLGWHEIINGLALLKTFLHLNEFLNSVNQQLNELALQTQPNKISSPFLNFICSDDLTISPTL